jgi:hypothetical protein
MKIFFQFYVVLFLEKHRRKMSGIDFGVTCHDRSRRTLVGEHHDIGTEIRRCMNETEKRMKILLIVFLLTTVLFYGHILRRCH